MTPLSDDSYKLIALELDPLKAPTRSRKTPKPPRAIPIDNLKPLAESGIPIIHVVGDKDASVPVSENTAIAEKRYKEMGGVFEVIHKNDVDHHPSSAPAQRRLQRSPVKSKFLHPPGRARGKTSMKRGSGLQFHKSQ